MYSEQAHLSQICVNNNIYITSRGREIKESNNHVLLYTYVRHIISNRQTYTDVNDLTQTELILNRLGCLADIFFSEKSLYVDKME